MSYTPLDQIPVLVDTARKVLRRPWRVVAPTLVRLQFFNTGATLPLGWRKQQLRQLIKVRVTRQQRSRRGADAVAFRR